ncbi:MAG: hypothetical protein KDF65_00085 [Anaerolineae bacterium]|nr:hypothetical protein [Anaerolineae bacterium]
MASFEEQVKKLSAGQIYTIQSQYDAAMDTEHGSGEHWLLIAALNQCGFPVRSVEQAIDTAERIIIVWQHLNN